MQAHVQDEMNWLVIGSGGGWRQFSRRSVLVMLIHLSGFWSRITCTHFINCAKSINFKENHQRVCYLYMEHFELGSVSSLSFNYSELI